MFIRTLVLVYTLNPPKSPTWVKVTESPQDTGFPLPTPSTGMSPSSSASVASDSLILSPPRSNTPIPSLALLPTPSFLSPVMTGTPSLDGVDEGTSATMFVFIFVAVLVGLSLFVVVITIVVMTFCLLGGKKKGTVVIRRDSSIQRPNQYSDSNGSHRPLYTEISKLPPPPLPERTSSSSVQSSIATSPPESKQLRPLPPPPVTFPQASAMINLYDIPESLHVDTTQSTGVYDMITRANIYEYPDGTIDPYYDEVETVHSDTGSPASSVTHSYLENKSSLSRHTSLRDHMYFEHLEPSMLQHSLTSLDALEQALPYAPVYDLPKATKRGEHPLYVTSENIIHIRDLGMGQFGQVGLAATKDLSPRDMRLGKSTDRSRSLLVAIKKLRRDADAGLIDTFEREIKFMMRLNHNNVVHLIGVCKNGEPFMMMEYMENGDLHGFLRKHKMMPDTIPYLNEDEVTPLILMYVAVQIASGMRYLSSLRFVHRDLATRNCLVGRDFVVKISDFGMSCSLYESFYYRVQGRLILPIRWMAFESFYGKFSVKSDAWSYGVTLWEIFTLAQSEPYAEMSDEEVIEDAINGTGRKLLPKPPACPKEVYDVMLRCWVHEPVMRADFEEVYSRLFLSYTNLSKQMA